MLDADAPYVRLTDVTTQQSLVCPVSYTHLRRNAPMQQRLARYTSEKWAREFLDAAHGVKQRQAGMSARLLGPTTAVRLLDAFRGSGRRALMLDYDGTLMPFSDDPGRVVPDSRLLELLERLSSEETDICLLYTSRCV